MKEVSQTYDNNPDNIAKINDLYIDSIKAKLALLDHSKTSPTP